MEIDNLKDNQTNNKKSKQFKISIDKENIEYVTPTTSSSKITEVHFTMLNQEEINREAEMEVTQHFLFQPNTRLPNPDGVLDHRLGAPNTDEICKTCAKMLDLCCGHFGVINLQLPVFHVGFFKQIIQVLQCICKKLFLVF